MATELTPETYSVLSAKLQKIAGIDGIDKLLAAHNLDALVCPTAKSSFPASMCGYPIATGAIYHLCPLIPRVQLTGHFFCISAGRRRARAAIWVRIHRHGVQ